MSVNFRYPNISGATEREQIAQIKSYLHQLVEQLNYAVPSLGSGDAQTYQVQGQEMSYYELRSLIIQELHEVQDTFDQLTKRFETDYVKMAGWEADRHLATDQNGNVVTVDNHAEVNAAVTEALTEAKENGDFTPVKGVDYFTEEELASVATQAAGKILFTMDEDGNLYYELEE